MLFLVYLFSELFAVETPVLSLILRGTILYLGILLLMRVLPRRTGGELAVMDLIFIILIAEGASHALGDYSTLSEGFIVIGTLMGWNYLINVLSYHSPFIEKLVSAPPLQIIKNGRLNRRNMHLEYLTPEELTEQMRKAGIDGVEKVKSAHVENDGKVSFVLKDDK